MMHLFITTKPYTKIVTNNLLKYDRQIIWNDVAYYVNNGRSMFRPCVLCRDVSHPVERNTLNVTMELVFIEKSGGKKDVQCSKEENQSHADLHLCVFKPTQYILLSINNFITFTHSKRSNSNVYTENCYSCIDRCFDRFHPFCLSFNR